MRAVVREWGREFMVGIDLQDGMARQNTLAARVEIRGVGLHTGRMTRLVICPAPAGHGIVFERSDLPETRIPALWNHVASSPLNTRLTHEKGAFVSTIEHLMAALAGLGVHNALCRIDGPEVPVLDGSAAPFVRALMQVGLRMQEAPLRVIEVLRHVEVERDGASAALRPSERVSMDFSIDFPDAAIGAQQHWLDLANGAFLRELCSSRTFCRHRDVQAMRENGLALGGNFNNAVVVEGARVLSPGGFRHDKEPVRHKMLDAFGDLYTAGAPILGHYEGHRAGHGLTNHLLRALFADSRAWRWRDVDARLMERLPGSHIAAADLHEVA